MWEDGEVALAVPPQHGTCGCAFAVEVFSPGWPETYSTIRNCEGVRGRAESTQNTNSDFQVADQARREEWISEGVSEIGILRQQRGVKYTPRRRRA